MASLGWIDFSPGDRNRIGTVLDLLRPEGMVDELGLATIRDALANQLFPGISTIQTKAKYFFIIPYILRDYQQLRPAQRRGKTALQYLEDREYEIMWDLAEHYNYQEGTGVIGITKKRPHKISRRPSAIYWNGLYTYNFIGTNGLSADTFLRQGRDQSIESLVSVQEGDDSNRDDADVEHDNQYHIRVPARTNWKNNLTLDLEKEEAEFFRDQIVSISKDKLIAELLKNDTLWEVFNISGDFIEFSKAASSLSLPSSLKHMLTLAHDFSQLMYGAHLAYNCQLQNKVFNSDVFDKSWEDWAIDLPHSMLDFAQFNPDILFSYTTTTKRTTIQFIKDWWKEAQGGFPTITTRDRLIKQQEAIVKGGKARLRWEKTDDTKENTWQGLRHFAYRFYQGYTILNDIRTGLSQ